MEFFSVLLGIDQDEVTKTDEEFNVLESINAHVNWKVRLESYLNGTSEEEFDSRLIARDDQCKLGKWIHGPGLEHFHADDVLFQILRDDHAHFHLVASQVVEHIQMKNNEAAKALMRDEYSQVSHKVVRDLSELQKHLSG